MSSFPFTFQTYSEHITFLIAVSVFKAGHKYTMKIKQKITQLARQARKYQAKAALCLVAFVFRF